MKELFGRERERRWQVLWITPELLMQALVNPRRDGDWIDSVHVEGLPDGCEIEEITYSFERRAFGMRIYHESFDVVGEGHMAPDLTLAVSFYRNRHRIADATVPRGREFI